MSTIQERFRKYLEIRAGQRGQHPEYIHTLNYGTETEIHLTTSDLEEAANVIDGLVDFLEQIKRRASHHPDDNITDLMRQNSHIRSLVTRALASTKCESKS